MNQRRAMQSAFRHLPYDPRPQGDSVLCVNPNHPENLFFVEAAKTTRVVDPAVTSGTRCKGITPLVGPSVTAVTSVGAFLRRNMYRDLFSILSLLGEAGLYDTYGSAIDSAGNRTLYVVHTAPSGQAAGATNGIIGSGFSGFIARLGDGVNASYKADVVRGGAVDLGVATNAVIQTPSAFPTPTLTTIVYDTVAGVTYYQNGELNGTRAASGVMTGNFTTLFSDGSTTNGAGMDFFLFDMRNTAHTAAQVRANSEWIRETIPGAW